jgi:preprotein translocase subunit SecF
MFNLMKFKYLFFAISLAVILPGLYSLARYGLKLSIDFTGGTLLEIQNPKLEAKDLARLGTVQPTANNSFLIRTKEMDAAQKDKLMADLNGKYGQTALLKFETVGPAVSQELTQKAFLSIIIASLAIIGYITYAFREIPPPYSSLKFGVAAVVALLHDVLVLVGIFSLLGHHFNLEVDVLFITATLTVIGFSVHDTIVVFDRIRENLRKEGGRVSFEQVVNDSLLQTLVRSLNTSLTTLFVMLAIILFGGESIRSFALALFIGIFSGTYSSIFNAAPLLVIWESRQTK